MDKRRICIALLIFAALPATVYGSVVVNEIAWMGTVNSAQDEWIEIAGPLGTNLDGWKLSTADGGTNIMLSGTVGSGGYFLIERTDDTTIPDVGADLVAVFGSGLGNTGEILILQDDQGNEIDRVDGSSNWAIGGNNTTKETLQRTSSGWTTATATPRAENNAGGAAAQESDNNKNNAPASGDSNATTDLPSSAYSAHMIEQKLRVYAGKDQTALVGALVTFEGYAEDKEGNLLPGARFLWNFGDGAVGEGKKVLHTYYYPGSYQVFLDASTALYSTTAALKVAVIPNLLGISEIKPGAWLELVNDTPRTVDISGLGVRINNEKAFYFPQNSFLGMQSYLVLNEERLGFTIPYTGTFQLLYPNGSVFVSTQYSSAILADNESVALTHDGWQKSVATPGEQNKLINRSIDAPQPKGITPSQVPPPPTSDDTISEDVRPNHTEENLDEQSPQTSQVLPTSQQKPASVFDSLRSIGSGSGLLFLGLAVAILASIASLVLYRFFI